MCIRDRSGVGVGLTGQLEPALVLLQPLLGAEGFVIPLIDAVNGLAVGPVSYTHLDVYKRQDLYSSEPEI